MPTFLLMNFTPHNYWHSPLLNKLQKIYFSIFLSIVLIYVCAIQYLLHLHNNNSYN